MFERTSYKFRAISFEALHRHCIIRCVHNLLVRSTLRYVFVNNQDVVIRMTGFLTFTAPVAQYC
jgi:hypothetical protein